MQVRDSCLNLIIINEYRIIVGDPGTYLGHQRFGLAHFVGFDTNQVIQWCILIRK